MSGCTWILDTDASDVAVGAVLSQIQNGIERPIAYYSRTLQPAERNYCVTRRELLAIKDGVRAFKRYLYGQKFTVRTDHGSLRWLLNMKDPRDQLARWLLELSSYNFDVIHRAGRHHANADGLSREMCKQCKKLEEQGLSHHLLNAEEVHQKHKQQYKEELAKLVCKQCKQCDNDRMLDAPEGVR